MNKSILFSGYYGFDNSGDDAILEAIIKELKQSHSELNIKVLSYQPEKTKRVYGVEALQRFKLNEVIKGIRETDLLISGGGSLLQDVTSSRSLWYYLGIMIMAKLFRKKIYVYANGVGPIDRPINRFMTRWVLNRADFITLRDKNSLEFIRTIGVKHNRVKVTADPVYTMDGVGETQVQDIFIEENIPYTNNYIGFTLRYWKKAPNLKYSIVKAIEELLRQREEDILFIPLHYPEDLEFAMEIRDLVFEKNRVYILKQNYSVRELIGCFSVLKTIVAMRLHSLIYAIIQKVPIVGLIYDPKVEALLEELTIQEAQDVEIIDAKKLVEDILRSLDEEENRRLQLGQKREIMRKSALENLKYIEELLEVKE